MDCVRAIGLLVVEHLGYSGCSLVGQVKVMFSHVTVQQLVCQNQGQFGVGESRYDEFTTVGFNERIHAALLCG